MKLYKILYFILAAIVFVACDDNEMKENTAQGVTVEFGTDSLITKEGQSIATIPVVAKGDLNGYVKVTLEVTQATNVAQDGAAIEDVHYYVTTKTLTIYPEFGKANFEITPTDDDVMGDGRTFIITITNVEGATLGARQQAIGFIADNDSKPYDRLCRTWIMKGVDGEDADMDVPFEMLGYPEGDFRYERMLQAVGDWMYGVDTLNLQFKSTGADTGFLTLLCGSTVARQLNFGSTYGICDLVLALGQDMALTGGIQGNWNSTFTEVSFGDQTIGVAVVSSDNNTTIGSGVKIGLYDQWSNISFVANDEE